MKAETRSGEFRGARASCALVVAFRRDGLFCAHAGEKIHGFIAADAVGSPRRRNAFANAQDARAPRSLQPHASQMP